jgi:hypothetical protein
MGMQGLKRENQGTLLRRRLEGLTTVDTRHCGGGKAENENESACQGRLPAA